MCPTLGGRDDRSDDDDGGGARTRQQGAPDMTVAGYILIGIGAVSLFGNLTGAGGISDPDPMRRNKRVIVWLAVMALGAFLGRIDIQRSQIMAAAR